MFLTVCNQKGGTGKTSVSLNLIQHMGFDTVIDCDVHKGITPLLRAGKSSVDLRSTKSEKDILKWSKEGKTVLVDCGGYDDDLNRYVLTKSSYILIPSNNCPTEQYSLVSFNEVLKVVSKKCGKKLIGNVLINRVHHGRSSFPELEKLISKLDHMELIPVIIPQSASIPKAAFKGQGVKSGAVAAKFSKLSKMLIEHHSTRG